MDGIMTIKMNRLAPLLAALLLTSPVAHTDSREAPEYATVGGWTIRVDTSLNDSCFALVTYEQGTVFRLGLDLTGEQIYIIVGDPNWDSIEYGKDYDIQLAFGERDEWDANATGFSFDPPEDQPYWAATVRVENGIDDFYEEFMREHYVTFYYEDEVIASLQLTDSYKVGLKLLECQEHITSQKRDPFALL